MSFDRPLDEVESPDEAVVLLPFSFVVLGAANPVTATVYGACIKGRAVTYVSAGLYTFVLNDKPYAVLGGSLTVSGGTSEDITAQLDATASGTTGVITCRFKAGTANAAPADGDVVYGLLVVTKTDRRRTL